MRQTLIVLASAATIGLASAGTEEAGVASSTVANSAIAVGKTGAASESAGLVTRAAFNKRLCGRLRYRAFYKNDLRAKKLYYRYCSYGYNRLERCRRLYYSAKYKGDLRAKRLYRALCKNYRFPRS